MQLVDHLPGRDLPVSILRPLRVRPPSPDCPSTPVADATEPDRPRAPALARPAAQPAGTRARIRRPAGTSLRCAPGELVDKRRDRQVGITHARIEGEMRGLQDPRSSISRKTSFACAVNCGTSKSRRRPRSRPGWPRPRGSPTSILWNSDRFTRFQGTHALHGRIGE